MQQREVKRREERHAVRKERSEGSGRIATKKEGKYQQHDSGV
jgi:hypothetical protein